MRSALRKTSFVRPPPPTDDDLDFAETIATRRLDEWDDRTLVDDCDLVAEEELVFSDSDGEILIADEHGWSEEASHAPPSYAPPSYAPPSYSVPSYMPPAPCSLAPHAMDPLASTAPEGYELPSFDADVAALTARPWSGAQGKRSLAMLAGALTCIGLIVAVASSFGADEKPRGANVTNAAAPPPASPPAVVEAPAPMPETHLPPAPVASTKLPRAIAAPPSATAHAKIVVAKEPDDESSMARRALEDARRETTGAL